MPNHFTIPHHLHRLPCFLYFILFYFAMIAARGAALDAAAKKRNCILPAEPVFVFSHRLNNKQQQAAKQCENAHFVGRAIILHSFLSYEMLF